MATDFGLRVTRILTQSGNYVTDLIWTHVTQQLGYSVYRSENNSDDPNDWYKINEKIIQVNYYQDRGFRGDPVNTSRSEWFYKVIPVSLDGGEYPLSQSKSETFEVPLAGLQRFVAPTIRSRTNILLDPSIFSAAEVVHFGVRKWAGSVCSCVDIRTRKVDANCAKCFGNFYEGGYSILENIYCHIRSAQKSLLAGSGGITVTENPTGIISTYPILTDGDILIRLHNERYRIRRVKRRQIQNYTTAQTFELERMQLYDMGYRVVAPAISEPTRRQGAEFANTVPPSSSSSSHSYSCSSSFSSCSSSSCSSSSCSCSSCSSYSCSSSFSSCSSCSCSSSFSSSSFSSNSSCSSSSYENLLPDRGPYEFIP